MKRPAVCLLSLSILVCAQNARAAAPSAPSPQDLFKEGKYADAQHAYEAVISAKRNSEIKEQRAYAELLLGYGRSLAAQRKFDEAFKMISQASAIADSFAMPGDFSRLLKTELEELRPKTALHGSENNAYYYHSSSNDKHDAAEQEYLAKAAIEFAKQRYGTGSISYLLRHIDYARFLCEQHRPDDLVQEAAICRDVFGKLPPDFQADTAQQILQLAQTLAGNRLPIEGDTVGGIVLHNIANGQLKDATQLADDLDRVAQSLENAQATDAAQKYYAASVRIFEKQVGADDPRLAKMRNSLAAFYKKHNKNGAAIELLELSVAAQQKNIALGSPDAVKALSELTELYCVVGNLQKAKECSQQLADALQHATADMDISVNPLMNAAALFAGKNDFDGAMKMYNAALKAGSLSRYHRNDYELQKQVRELAVRVGAQGHPEQAAQIYDSYIASRSTALGQPTQGTLAASLEKATFFLEQELFDKAASAAMQAVELSSKFSGNQDYQLNQLSQQFYDHKQYDIAIKLAQAWLASMDSSRNFQTYQVVEAKIRIANIYNAQGKTSESITALQDASKLAFDKLSKTSPELHEKLEALANRLITEQKIQPATELVTAVAQLNNYQNVIDGMIRIVYLLSNEKMYTECEDFLQALVDANGKAHGPSSQQVARAMGELSRIYVQSDQAEKGEELQRAVNAINALQRKQEQTNPHGTDIYDPRAPLADTIKAATALGPLNSTVVPAEGVLIHTVRSIHVRDVRR